MGEPGHFVPTGVLIVRSKQKISAVPTSKFKEEG
jgi:hypothetical protein